MDANHLTFGLAAGQIGNGAMPYHISKLAKKNLIPFERAGRFHIVRVSDLPKIKKALAAAGYIKLQPEALTA
jgi:hypothetical protein